MTRFTEFAHNLAAIVTAHLLFTAGLTLLAYVALVRFEKHLIGTGHADNRLRLVRRFLLPVLIFLLSLMAGLVPASVDLDDHLSSALFMVGKLGTIFAGVVILLKMIRVAVSVYSERLRIDQPDNLRQRRLKTQVLYLEKVLDIVVIFIGVTAIMLSFESFRRLGGSLLASAGLASVILGFSAQRSLGNLIAGFQIAFTQPIRLGDSVFVENEWGEIEEIALTYVVVKIWDLRRLILPITYFLEKPFQNWTRNSANLIGQVLLYMDYSTPIEPLRAELMRVLANSTRWDHRVASLQVTDSSDRVITIRALMSAQNSSLTFDLRCEVREALVRFIQKNYPESLPRHRLDAERVNFLPTAANLDPFARPELGPRA